MSRITSAEWLTYLRECDETEAMQIAKAWENNPSQFEAGRLAAGDPPEDVTALAAECRRLREKVRGLTSVSLLAWAEMAQTIPSEPIGDQEPDEPPGVTPPCFRTGVARLDHHVGGGAYGMTVVAAEAKCGKSMFALASAIEAARDGWRVLYLNGELTRSEMSNRVMRYCGGRPRGDWLEQLSIHPVELGITVPHIIGKIRERIEIEDTRLLLVVDSINRVSDMSQMDGSEHGYWHTMREWQEWFRRASKISEGQIASLVVSELNASGHLKGRSLEYAADLVVRIAPVKDAEPGVFAIDVPYARSSASGAIGDFKLKWRDGCFEFIGDSE